MKVFYEKLGLWSDRIRRLVCVGVSGRSCITVDQHAGVIYLLELFVCVEPSTLTNGKRIREKMEHPHISVTGSQVHCSEEGMTAAFNYNQWRLIPAFREKQKSQQSFPLAYHIRKYVPKEAINHLLTTNPHSAA